MKIYLVGGAVRDKLLGFPIKERDFVVVGSTVAEMLRLGFRQVGKEFPVFLHPKTKEEYALARAERKVKPGYQGFEFDTDRTVTLEEDLIRRDLTINAMAYDEETNQLIDPFHGKADLEQRLLRHVSPAFAEDPVRILRIGRFLARYHGLGFHIYSETLLLMKTMVNAGEVNALVAERVWKELERALLEPYPTLFFSTLEQCGALSILFPGLTQTSRGMKALLASSATTSAAVRFAALLHDLNPDVITSLCERYRVPKAFRDLAVLTARHFAMVLRVATLTTEEWLQLFNAMDLFRREMRFNEFIEACIAIAEVDDRILDVEKIRHCANEVKSIDVQAILNRGLQGGALVDAIQAARKEKIALFLAK
ncbi:MAG: multifunctional CCA tRNA nucleotidyl transferase/2'3'-cyclic phosphodiesterase/2'nucleotidase/phosphatase [Gammaproteobacteria bacterium]|nr:multifunctional CCA tRNA nucleotidyl transferase/2'3'-cyclic phosphodiesterase/2'nucleotidase/phosphatase [Gammaproteobacteria bacterium]